MERFAASPAECAGSSSRWGIVGVPSSAAAHWAGIEKAPAALRAAGLVDALSNGSVAVKDFGDQQVAHWATHRTGDGANNVEAVRAVLDETRQRIVDVLTDGLRPFVIGGECTLAVAMVSAFAECGRDVGVVYVDGGQDLMTPVDNRDEPILDGMGVAHMLDLPGTEDVISGIGPRRPLLRDSDIVFLGYADEEEDIHDVVHSGRIPSSLVSADPEAAAFRALAALSAASIVIHIDVDVLDFLQVPAADVPTYGRGLSIEDLSATLRILFSDPRCAGALLVEYNPDHDRLGRAAAQLVEMIRATASG
ncbi:arginase family protein [Microbacterium sp. B35-30]|uniref:arginase family protein n=1 Tax=Microbacterium sp. B35-30 TaxID=1962642 RepID=UPI0013CF4316|nr:arginase family protein [Microbacterium sp. B35-30]KAF2420402.1 hypothetical protein B2K11_01625 [Microbacterium sp. B35-30]